MSDESLFDVSSEEEEAPRGTFGRRLALAFATVAALTVAIAAILISMVWNYQFDQYLRGNLQRIADGVAQVAAEAYPVYGGWSLQTLSAVPRFGSMRGVAIQISNASGATIYDDTTMLRGVHTDITGQDFLLDPDGPVSTAPVVVNDITVGRVRVWAYGPGALLTDRDVQFRSGSLSALVIAALVAILLASLAGFWYARRLTRPIAAITNTALALRGGDRQARTGLRGSDEIAVLGRTFDEMADSIEADRELERRLTADVAHELRTPLQAIQATVEAMQDGVLPADEERLATLHHETVRLSRLADGILELTRLERGSVPFDLRRIELAVPLRAAAESHLALIEAHELSFRTSLQPGVWVTADADRLQQAVANLLSNAARYTPAGGSVELALRAESGCAFIEVTDTGIGIAEEDRARVFSRFWRADAARATATGGLGIGLAVTREIIERHRGSIAIEDRPSGGTTFVIRLPLSPSDAGGRAAQEATRDRRR